MRYLPLRIVVPVVLIVLSLLAYMPALDGEIVYWDDDHLLLYNTKYRGFSAENVRWMLTTSHGGHYHPLTWMSYALDWSLWKRELFGYRLTNVTFHVLTALAFYFLARRLLAIAVGRPQAVRSARFILAAGFAAALFALHPLRAESVAWMAQRRDVVSGFFYVLAVLSYVRYAVARATNGHDFTRASANGDGKDMSGWGFYGASVALCATSLLAKAAAMTMPLVLLILDWYPLRRFPGSRLQNSSAESLRAFGSEERAGRILLEKAPFFVLAFAAGMQALAAQSKTGALYPIHEHGIPERLAQACYGLAFYLWKSIWPANLGPLYELPIKDALFGPQLWISLLVVGVVAVVAIRLRHSVPALTAALATYAVLLLPTLGFAQSGPQLVADRYSYLSCMGLAIVAAGAVLWLSRSAAWIRSRNGFAMLSLSVACLLTLLVRSTYGQSDIWRSSLSLWIHGVRVSPGSAIAHTNLGDALVRSEHFPQAAAHYRKALELNPADAVAHQHLGDLLGRYGRIEAAIHHYLAALSVDPGRPRACLSLGRALYRSGRVAEAVAVLRDGAKRNPEALDLLEHLARILSVHPDANVRNGDEAVELALRVNEAKNFGDIPSLLTLATAYADAGRFSEAVHTTQYALTLVDLQTSDSLAGELERRLALFLAGKAYHLEPEKHSAGDARSTLPSGR